MRKLNLKRYNKEILSKDFYISFMAGLGGGLTAWFFTLIIPYLLNKEYSNFIKGFILYLIIGFIIFYSANYILIKFYGKKKQ